MGGSGAIHNLIRAKGWPVGDGSKVVDGKDVAVNDELPYVDIQTLRMGGGAYYRTGYSNSNKKLANFISYMM